MNHFVEYVLTFITADSTDTYMTQVTLRGQERREESEKCQGISHWLKSGHPNVVNCLQI